MMAMDLEKKREWMMRSCLRKTVYKTSAAAHAAIHGWGRKEAKLAPYNCQICGDWHIGHKIPKAVRLAE